MSEERLPDAGEILGVDLPLPLLVTVRELVVFVPEHLLPAWREVRLPGRDVPVPQPVVRPPDGELVALPALLDLPPREPAGLLVSPEQHSKRRRREQDRGVRPEARDPLRPRDYALVVRVGLVEKVVETPERRARALLEGGGLLPSAVPEEPQLLVERRFGLPERRPYRNFAPAVVQSPEAGEALLQVAPLLGDLLEDLGRDPVPLADLPPNGFLLQGILGEVSEHDPGLVALHQGVVQSVHGEGERQRDDNRGHRHEPTRQPGRVCPVSPTPVLLGQPAVRSVPRHTKRHARSKSPSIPMYRLRSGNALGPGAYPMSGKTFLRSSATVLRLRSAICAARPMGG